MRSSQSQPLRRHSPRNATKRYSLRDRSPLVGKNPEPKHKHDKFVLSRAIKKEIVLFKRKHGSTYKGRGWQFKFKKGLLEHLQSSGFGEVTPSHVAVWFKNNEWIQSRGSDFGIPNVPPPLASIRSSRTDESERSEEDSGSEPSSMSLDQDQHSEVERCTTTLNQRNGQHQHRVQEEPLASNSNWDAGSGSGSEDPSIVNGNGNGNGGSVSQQMDSVREVVPVSIDDNSQSVCGVRSPVPNLVPMNANNGNGDNQVNKGVPSQFYKHLGLGNSTSNDHQRQCQGQGFFQSYRPQPQAQPQPQPSDKQGQAQAPNQNATSMLDMLTPIVLENPQTLSDLLSQPPSLSTNQAYKLFKARRNLDQVHDLWVDAYLNGTEKTEPEIMSQLKNLYASMLAYVVRLSGSSNPNNVPNQHVLASAANGNGNGNGNAINPTN